MLRPTAEQLRLLTPTERACFAVADTVNRRPAVKRAAHTFLRTVGREWVRLFTDRLLHVEGIDRLRALDPDRGVFLISNHRSFFDFYVASSVILKNTSWVERMYFPVRSTFFYEGVAGNLVNMVMSAWAMYPPVLRDPDRRAFNQYTVGFLKEELQRRGTLVGYHPEGSRGKGPDPYALLPSNVGAGAIVHAARPIVLPMFTLGLINDLPRQIASNFDGSGAPVTVVFGEPLDLDDYYAMPDEPATHRALADRLRDALVSLGHEERVFRAAEGLPPMGPSAVSATSGEGGEGDEPGER